MVLVLILMAQGKNVNLILPILMFRFSTLRILPSLLTNLGNSICKKSTELKEILNLITSV